MGQAIKAQVQPNTLQVSAHASHSQKPKSHSHAPISDPSRFLLPLNPKPAGELETEAKLANCKSPENCNKTTSITLMHPSLQSNPSSRLYLNPCKSKFTQYPIFFHFPQPRKFSEIARKSLRTSIDFEQEGVSKEEQLVLPSNVTRLPIVIKNSGRVSRYVLKGGSLELVCVDEDDDDDSASFSALGLDDRFSKLIRLSSSAAKDFFIPKQVNDNYISYVKWKFLHRVFSSALQVLATQVIKFYCFLL